MSSSTQLHQPSRGYYLISDSHDPFYNIALEDYLYQQMRELSPIYMLWVNQPSVFMGRYQHAEAETDWDYLQKQQIPILRRSSGGGTVYHDWGNLNFSSIQTDKTGKGFDLTQFPQPIISLAGRAGVELELSPRGDLRLSGRKVGGSAETMRSGRMLYHISLLFDANLDELERVLSVPEHITARSRVASVRSRVTNLSSVLPELTNIEDFIQGILGELRLIHSELIPLSLPEDAEEYIERMQQTKFKNPEWIHSAIGKAKNK